MQVLRSLHLAMVILCCKAAAHIANLSILTHGNLLGKVVIDL